MIFGVEVTCAIPPSPVVHSVRSRYAASGCTAHLRASVLNNTQKTLRQIGMPRLGIV